MSYLDEPKAAPVPHEVIYRSRTSPAVIALLVILIVCVLALTIVVSAPSLGLKMPSAAAPRSKEQIVSELDPQSLVLPNGRQLSLVEFGQRVFEVTRISYDPSGPGRSLVYITVPGLPPQQGVYRAGDSFDRGRIHVRDVMQQSVILACDGQQQEFRVYGAGPDAPAAPSPTGFNFMPPKDLSSGGVIPEAIPGATGRIKAPLNPRTEPDTPVGSPEEPAPDNPKSLEDFPDLRPYDRMTRAEYKAFSESLDKEFFDNLVVANAIDPDNLAPYGLEIKKIMAECSLYKVGLRVGDVVIQVGETEVRTWRDLREAVRANGYREGIMIHVMRNDLLVSFDVMPNDASK